MKKTHWIRKFHLPNWVVAVLTLVLILRIPSFFEPYYYGDEMIYLSLGQGVRQGLTLFKNIHDNKPPLLYLIAAVAGNLFWFKAILAFFNLSTVAFFYKMANILFEKNEKTVKVSTLIFAILTTIPLFEGNTVNAELFMIGFNLIAIFILLSKQLTSKKIFLAGILFGIGTLFKIPAAFDLPVIVIFWLLTTDLKNWKVVIKNTFILGLGFILPILLTFVWYFAKGALMEYIRAAFMQNVGYLSSFRPGDVQKPFYVRNAPLLIRASISFVGILILFIFRKKLSKNFILFSTWTLIGLFAVTLSERPYPHYFVQVLPPVSLLLGMFFTDKSLEQSLIIIPLTVSFFVPVYYKFYYYKTADYYLNFLKFATGRIEKNEYFRYFSKTTSRNYKISDFIVNSSSNQERVFVWDPDSPTIYSLSRHLPPIKYVADYHINDFSSQEKIAEEIELNPPKFIVLTSKRPFFSLTSLIHKNYVLISQIEDAKIYSRMNLVTNTK